MSNRERWIIYPLVFFALAAALRDKISSSVTADFIRCRTLEVTEQIQCKGHVSAGGVYASSLTGDNIQAQKLAILDRHRRVTVEIGTLIAKTGEDDKGRPSQGYIKGDVLKINKKTSAASTAE